ncbi:hypothetical protein QBC35DRAFT_386644 [Podospora australis]|uniref:DUF4604 domain-containing protein n=1 Tax=Podospora australis TaxID=1536484 RepID=A0AAN7AHZ7_9PEZI|nr:hypothetical protein QBC35DRAFT_386644 [Podospora australis]
MPGKTNAKNLQYNTTLPPFLARLRGEAPSDPNSPDPILVARRRPNKKRSGSAEAEDLPTVVDEHGNTVSNVTLGADGSATVLDHEDSNNGKTGEAAAAAPSDDKAVSTTTEKDGQKTSIGANKKRKVGKVIGRDADEEDDNGEGKQPPAKKGKPATSTKAAAETDKKEDDSTPKPKAKKKIKKIKLSFGDEEEG